MEWTLKTFDELSNYELYSILDLRNKVFVVEQECIYLDTDGADLQAYHLFASEGESTLAYCRIFLKDVKYKNASSIGRVVVEEAERNKNLGNKLMRRAISFLKSCKNQGPTIISAQSHLQSFYENLGFEATDDSYLEDGIPHLKMILEY